MSRIYKFYATTSATANALASIQVLATARIKSIRWRAQFDSITDGAFLYAEISTQAVNQGTVHNPQGIISCIRACSNFVTSGLDIASFSQQDLVDCPITLGQLIYLNVLVPAGTITAYFDVFVDCSA